MSITLRRYKLLSDFERVNKFLRQNFTVYQQNGNIPQPFWEYAHAHPDFNHKLTHRFGIWEENEQIIAVACYEMDLGECLLITNNSYDYMKPALIDYAEKELCKESDNMKSLEVWTYDYDTQLNETLLQKGYKKKYNTAITIFKYDNGFQERVLPEGFSILSLEDEIDFRKINEVIWRGFNHGDVPDYDLDGIMRMQSAPNFRKDLITIIKAPNGDYACYAGMWLDGVNDFAYLEPLATDPRYRRMGLATMALTRSMKNTVKFGAKYCFGGDQEFYSSIGFETVCHREKWTRIW